MSNLEQQAGEHKKLKKERRPWNRQKVGHEKKGASRESSTSTLRHVKQTHTHTHTHRNVQEIFDEEVVTHKSIKNENNKYDKL